MRPDAYNRPWLALYQPDRGLLAQRVAEQAARNNVAESSTTAEGLPLPEPLPLEVWLQIAAYAGHFSDLCRLSQVCRSLWALGRHPLVWEVRCRTAFCLPGQLSCEALLRRYDFSWQRMFRHRPRLRFDGIYFNSHTKLIRGVDEGRGMKEKDVSTYSACGKWSTYYRALRFYSDGSMWIDISSNSPVDLRKAASAVTPARPATLRQKIKGACWGTYTLREVAAEAGRPNVRLFVEATVSVKHEDYPRMKPAEVIYSFGELCAARAIELWLRMQPNSVAFSS